MGERGHAVLSIKMPALCFHTVEQNAGPIAEDMVPYCGPITAGINKDSCIFARLQSGCMGSWSGPVQFWWCFVSRPWQINCLLYSLYVCHRLYIEHQIHLRAYERRYLQWGRNFYLCWLSVEAMLPSPQQKVWEINRLNKTRHSNRLRQSIVLTCCPLCLWVCFYCWCKSTNTLTCPQCCKKKCLAFWRIRWGFDNNNNNYPQISL